MRHAWAIGLALIFFAASADADTPPSVWSRARDPEAALAYDVHEQVQRRLAVLRDGSEHIDERDLRAVLPILQHAQSETSKSALLSFDLAFVYYEKGEHAIWKIPNPRSLKREPFKPGVPNALVAQGQALAPGAPPVAVAPTAPLPPADPTAHLVRGTVRDTAASRQSFYRPQNSELARTSGGRNRVSCA